MICDNNYCDFVNQSERCLDKMNREIAWKKYFTRVRQIFIETMYEKIGVMLSELITMIHPVLYVIRHSYSHFPRNIQDCQVLSEYHSVSHTRKNHYTSIDYIFLQVRIELLHYHIENMHSQG